MDLAIAEWLHDSQMHRHQRLTMPPRVGKMLAYERYTRAATRARLRGDLAEALGWRKVVYLAGDMVMP